MTDLTSLTLAQARDRLCQKEICATELIEAERLAIKTEFPKFNKVHNDRTLRRELVQHAETAA